MSASAAESSAARRSLEGRVDRRAEACLVRRRLEPRRPHDDLAGHDGDQVFGAERSGEARHSGHERLEASGELDVVVARSNIVTVESPPLVVKP